MTIHIKEQDFKYLEYLVKDFSEEQRKRYTELLREAVKERTGKEDAGKIIIAHKELVKLQSPEEVVTKTLIRKIYKAVKAEMDAEEENK